MLKLLERMNDKIKGSKIEISTNKLVASCCFVQGLFFSFFLYQGYERDYLFHNLPNLDAKPALEKSCHLAMTSILQKRVSIAIFDETIVEKINEENYSFFDFVGDEKIFDIVKGKPNHCTVIITDKLGHRFFKLSFKDSDGKYHFYGRYIDAIEEITHKELTEGL